MIGSHNDTQQVSAADLQPDYLKTQRADPRAVTFSAAQLSVLESMFPESYGYDLTDGQLRYRAGQRSVLAFIRSKTNGHV